MASLGGDVSDAAALLRVIDHARQLNLRIDIARLERMRFVYRSWIASAASVEAGFSLARDELECVLEYPPLESGHLDFLMDTFRATNEPDADARIDFLTLLAACTCLARGPLEAKAKFLFSLVDLDTEDEIVEDELAMVIALCSDGLRRLGVVVTELVDLDARAIACEAFEFVEVDDGGKMSLALFVQWLVSHWRPAALLDRIQSLFLISRITQRLHEAQEQLTVAEESSPLQVPKSAQKDPVNARIVADPIVAPVSLNEVPMPKELNRATAVSSTVGGPVWTPHKDPAAVRVLVLADDAFCDLPVTARRDLTPGSVTSHMGNIRRHLIDGEGHSVMYDMTIHVGSIAALQNDLLRGHEMLRRDLTGTPASLTRLEDMVRTCYRSYTAIPDVRALRSCGRNWFSGIGIVRSLVQKAAPIRLLRAVAKVVHGCEGSDVTLDRHASRLVHRLASGIFAVTLDTTDCLFGSANAEFVEWPESLLTARQLSAICHVLQDSRQSSSPSNQVLILCDAPFVWPFAVNRAQKRKAEHDKALAIARDPWAAYDRDLRRLLDLLFDAVAKSSKLRITLVCNGVFASRVIIAHRESGRSIEQLSLGTISNIDSQQATAVRYAPESMKSSLGDDYSVTARAAGDMALSLKQYCILNIVPHARGAVCSHSFYTAGRPEASLVLGPVIGRVTTRTARILIEVDRPVQTVTCMLSAASSGHSVATACELLAFVPTVFKLEGLHPGTRYKVKFEGLMAGNDDIDAYVETPSPTPVSVEWLVFSRNNLRHFLSPRESGNRDSASHWHRILSSGARSYNTQPASVVANRSGDSLGESLDQQSEEFNPWYHAEAFALSEPLRQTQLSVHIGGQVDLRNVLADEELSTLIAQLCGASISQEAKNRLYVSVRFRLQEEYRTTWAVEPMRNILSRSSNVMLLHEETDLFFSTARIHELIRQRSLTDEGYIAPTDDQVSQVADRLRAIAFELWQLYQNQLSVDVNESDLDNSRRNSSKFTSHLTLGMCRLLFTNVSDELRDICSSFPAAVEKDKAHSETTQAHGVHQVVPLTLPKANDLTQLPLFSAATWKIVDDALDIDAGSGAQKGTRRKTQGISTVKQIVVFLPTDLIEMVNTISAVRSEVVRLLEKLFQWKMAARAERNVSLICASERASSVSFTITDEKVNETLSMTRVSSISELKDAPTTKSASVKNKQVAKNAPTIKGYFSKRFTYQSTPIATGTATSSTGTHCRSYANYTFLSDYRRGFLNERLLFFPAKALPRIVLGPVVGRMVRKEQEEVPVEDATEGLAFVVSFSVPILVEINSPTRITCVVVDSMINSERRITRELPAFVPTPFCFSGLVPLRRYVYFFEGVSNGDVRRGCFHTPPSESNSLYLVAVSSNFPTQMDEEQDSLWVPLLERAKLPWCGLDAFLHLGGQVPLHEAAIECFEWARRELIRETLHGDPKEVEAKRVAHVRARIRRRFQQEYYICWNLPNIRELLAHASHWFLQSKADIAPFYGREHPGPIDASRATALVVDVAREVVRSYQLQLMTASIREEDEAKSTQSAAMAPPTEEEETKPVEATAFSSAAPSPLALSAEPDASLSSTKVDPAADKLTEVVENNPDTAPTDEILDSGGAVYWQQADIAVFMADMRSAGMHESSGSHVPEPITCNGRLSRPLSQQENPMMSETQWRYFESVLRKKRTLLLVLCMELPLILTNAVHVEKLREDLHSTSAHQSPWKLYDHTHVLQHWVACKRQLEQLLVLLFKWKAKHSGRDVLLLSGGMRIGIDTLLRDRETKLSIRNLTVGPVTAHVEMFEFPLNGVACATFGGGIKDDHFTFHHGLLAKKNYVLLRMGIDHQQSHTHTEEAPKTASVVADFVPNEPAALARLHPLDKFRRFPLWWTTYVPMGKCVFWDDTITLKSETDERMLALREYVWHDRGFSGALEIFYEKYQFAETARMEELRSRHSQHVDLQANFLHVLTDLWRAIPDSKRQQLAYFLDPFVREMLLAHVAPDLISTRLPSGEPIELTFFTRVLREFVFEACLLRLTIVTQQEDEVRAHREELEKRKRDAERAALEKARAEQAAQQEAARMAELLHSDPVQYAAIKLAQEEAEKREQLARHQEKLDRKKAARVAELEEERAIAKEQKRLSKLAEQGDAAVEYERRQRELDARIRRLEETRAQRAAQKKAAAEKAARNTVVDA